MSLRKLCFLAGVAALAALPATGNAVALSSGPWTISANGGIYVDFALAAGSSGVINLYVQSDDPNATVYLGAPNEVFASGVIDNNGTMTNVSDVGLKPYFTWDEVVAPGHTTITWTTAANYNHCATEPANYVGVCAATNNFWGNADGLTVHSTTSAVVSLTPFASGPSAAPEPASWALLLAGFTGLGAALRRRREQAVAA